MMTKIAALPRTGGVSFVSFLLTLLLWCVFLPSVHGSEERAPRGIFARQAPLPGWVGGFQGFCVNCQGQDVNSGQIVVVADRSVTVANCLAACAAIPGLTACEMTHYAHTSFGGGGCYAHTNPTICRGSESPLHYCWLMSASPTSSAPTSTPTSVPTVVPTSAPTHAPSSTPTYAPTTTPTAAPTAIPSFAPTMRPACNGVPDPAACPSLYQHCATIAASCPGTCSTCTPPPTTSPTSASANPLTESPTTEGHTGTSIGNENSGTEKPTG